jgi:hypothetical protein
LNRTQLFGSWRHAHEEDDAQRVVFRRAGADLPPSRGREALDLEPDGTAVRIGIDGADRPLAQSCRWILDGDEVVLMDGETELRRMRVAEVTLERIVFERRRGQAVAPR